MKAKAIIYEVIDAKGKSTTVVVNEHSDSVCFHGMDANGKSCTYDGEAWYCYSWARLCGFVIKNYEVEINLDKNKTIFSLTESASK